MNIENSIKLSQSTIDAIVDTILFHESIVNDPTRSTSSWIFNTTEYKNAVVAISNGVNLRNIVVRKELEATLVAFKDRYGSTKKAYKMLNEMLNLTDIRSSDLKMATKLSFRRYPDGYISSNVELPDKPYINQYFKCFSYSQMIDIIRLIKQKGISYHEFTSNLPAISKQNRNRQEVIDEIYEFLKKSIQELSYEKLLRIIRYLNYRRVRNSTSYDNAIEYIDMVELAKSKIFNGNGSVKSSVANGMLIYNDNEYPTVEDETFFITKEPSEVLNIGKKTLCCFHSGGAARSLLKPALKSPIAGIVEGQFSRNDGKKVTWFSFIWEIVEFNKDTNTFDICLILDNIEASSALNYDEFKIVLQKLSTIKAYKKIYLGTLRNDIPYCYIDDVKETVKQRYRRLVRYEDAFKKYGTYDDSASIYTLKERNDDNVVVLSRMNSADFHRVEYVENIVWGENHDTDYNLIERSNSPSYVLQSNTSIFGYLLTSMMKYNVSTKRLMTVNEYKNEVNTYCNDNEIDRTSDNEEYKKFISQYENVIYFEDMFIHKNKVLLSTIKYMIEDITKYVHDNNIKYWSASMNDNSSPFRKRMNELTYIEDKRFNEPLQPILGHNAPVKIGEMTLKTTLIKN